MLHESTCNDDFPRNNVACCVASFWNQFKNSQHEARGQCCAENRPRWHVTRGSIFHDTVLRWKSLLQVDSCNTALKPLANGFNIYYNIHSILSNNNVETVCHPLLNMLKHVETKSKGRRKSLKGFKLCFNILSIFLLFSKMLKVVEAVCAGLSTLSNKRMRDLLFFKTR